MRERFQQAPAIEGSNNTTVYAARPCKHGTHDGEIAPARSTLFDGNAGHFLGSGKELWALANEHALEGIVSKDAESP